MRDEIILERAAPIIKDIIRRRLGQRVDQTRIANIDSVGADLYHEVIVKLAERLNDLQINPGRPINNFSQYVARVTINVCNDYLRLKHPVRYRLKHSLRFLIDRHPDFSMWSSTDDELVVGFKDWMGQKSPIDSAGDKLLNLNPAQIKALLKSEKWGNAIRLSSLVGRIFSFLGAPISFERFVDIVAHALEIEDHSFESLDSRQWYWEELIIDQTLEIHSQLAAKEILTALWLEACQLPKNQRQVFCLTFTDDDGSDIVSLLVDFEIRSLKEIAEDIEMPLANLSKLWPFLPLKNPFIATEMKVTAEQVSKWRHRAGRKMQKIISALWNYGANLPSIVL